MGPNVEFSAHARSRMVQRGISDRDVLIIVNGGSRAPEPAAAGGAMRWKYSGVVNGRHITVIVAEEGAGLVVLTAY